ncbi:hypothetical protein ACFC26_17500 [Kitasatospora purpeofusca]
MSRLSREARQAATLRHNNARGKDTIEGLHEMVLELSRSGKSYAWFEKELGLEPDAVVKLVMETGLAEQHADRDYSEAWAADTPAHTPWDGTDS